MSGSGKMNWDKANRGKTQASHPYDKWKDPRTSTWYGRTAPNVVETDPEKQRILDTLEAHGFKCVNPKSDWVPPKLPRISSL